MYLNGGPNTLPRCGGPLATMDPRDRLWLELIFPRCDVASLLASRAVCRASWTRPRRACGCR